MKQLAVQKRGIFVNYGKGRTGKGQNWEKTELGKDRDGKGQSQERTELGKDRARKRQIRERTELGKDRAGGVQSGLVQSFYHHNLPCPIFIPQSPSPSLSLSSHSLPNLMPLYALAVYVLIESIFCRMCAYLWLSIITSVTYVNNTSDGCFDNKMDQRFAEQQSFGSPH